MSLSSDLIQLSHFSHECCLPGWIYLPYKEIYCTFFPIVLTALITKKNNHFVERLYRLRKLFSTQIEWRQLPSLLYLSNCWHFYLFSPRIIQILPWKRTTSLVPTLLERTKEEVYVLFLAMAHYALLLLTSDTTGSSVFYLPGDRVYHRWSCQASDSVEKCLTVHSCTMSKNGNGNTTIIDNKGYFTLCVLLRSF